MISPTCLWLPKAGNGNNSNENANNNHHHRSLHHRSSINESTIKSADDDCLDDSTMNKSAPIKKCTLNDDQCLSLNDILCSFQTAINEEQAWALCYQLVKCFNEHYKPSHCYLITDPSHVLIHKEGFAHKKTLYQQNIQGKSRTLAKSSHKLLTSLGIVLFHALDYGLCEDEERTLSKPLELLIERLTTAYELATRQKKKNHGRKKKAKSNCTTNATNVNTGSNNITSTSMFKSSTCSTSSCLMKNANTKHNNNNDELNSIELISFDEENDQDDDHPYHDHVEDIAADDDDVEVDDDEDDVDDEDIDLMDNDLDDEDECANADEGIERDCHEYIGDTHSSLSHNTCSPSSTLKRSSSLLTFDQVMQMCVSRLSSRESADNHYRAVCRALLAETLELSTFLDQIAKGTKELRKSSVLTIESNINNDSDTTLEQLQFYDWARLWIQVIKELRHGVKLKKVDQEDLTHNTEYELTPYEMLLDDIRSRRYKLNKVMVNGDLPPRVKKDAHELILDFIRSRPPLVPVSKRILKPAPPKQVTLYEKLMESIRQEHKLKPIPKPLKTYSFSAHVTPIHQRSEIFNNDRQPEMKHSEIEATVTLRPRRKKVIKANINLNQLLDDADEEERFCAEMSKMTNGNNRNRPVSAFFPTEMNFDYLEEMDTHLDNINGKEHLSSLNINDEQNDKVSDELISAENSTTLFRLKKLSSRLFMKERRHSISVCDLDTIGKENAKHRANDLMEDIDFNEDSRNHVANMWEKNNFGKSLECLSLTLKEVQHIRSVLTKAEIESLGVTRTLRKELENGKICFTCLKTRFTFFGPWAIVCKLCNRAICERCTTKMHIPTEQFDHVPIYMLSPTSSPPNERRINDIFSNTLELAARKSPEDVTKTETGENENETKSLPTKLSTVSRGGMKRLVRMLTSTLQDGETSKTETTMVNDSNEKSENKTNENHRNGPLVKVCRDCKILVRHLIDIGHANFTGAKV